MIGDESLICEKEKRNVYDPHAMAIIQGNFAVGHVPQNICDIFGNFCLCLTQYVLQY